MPNSVAWRLSPALLLLACTERGLWTPDRNGRSADLGSSIDASMVLDASEAYDAAIKVYDAAIEVRDASIAVDLAPLPETCPDPLGCYPATSVNASYYSGLNCDGTEYATRLVDGEVFHSTWDGRGLVGRTDVTVYARSWRAPSGSCYSTTLTSFVGYRIYRDATGPCVCPPPSCIDWHTILVHECAADDSCVATSVSCAGVCSAALGQCVGMGS